MKLIATYPILFESKQYQVGQELPAHNIGIVDAWIEAKTAVWKDGNPRSVAKARMATAMVGLVGESPNGETPENLAGKVPETAARSKAGRKSGG